MAATEAKRSANFTTSEVEYLIKLVGEKKNIIECKKTDRTTAAEKVYCWMEIQDDFNAQFDCYRSYKTLKVKYDNVKKTAKRNYALDKKELYQTGGGPKPPSNISAIDVDIIEMLEVEQVEGLPSTYDDDELEIIVPDKKLNEGANECFDEKSAESSPESLKQKWKKYNPKMLRARKHSALEAENKKKTRDIWAEVAQIKLKKCELEIKVIEEEGRLRKTKLELEIEELKLRIEKLSKTSSLNFYPKDL